MIEQYLTRIKQILRVAHSETGLQVRLEPLLTEMLAAFGITYTPSINETLKSQGLSQADSTRPDSLFGHVVLDYKSPGLLSSPRELRQAKQQIEGYLNTVSEGPDKPGAILWAGCLWDGSSLCFCHSNGDEWTWSRVFEISEGALLTLVGMYRSLQRKPLSARLLAASFGKNSDIARQMLVAMCERLSNPRHRTTMLFAEWRRLFEQVSTYELDQLPGLKSWARSLGIATEGASEILFAIHSYYALVVKLLTSELLSAVSPVKPDSLCQTIANATNSEAVYKHISELEDGEYWGRYRISNFLEGDFFSWYTNDQSDLLARAIQEVAREFLSFEPTTAIVRPETIKDLLKEFYSTLVDEQLRHDLGEYYTPDWLAQRVLDIVGYDGDLGSSLLDPACGSGTFLVEAMARVRQKAQASGISSHDLLRIVLRNIKGLDLNPLAVISARANFVLTIADLIFTIGDDVELPIYLADAVNVPLKKTAVDGLEVLKFSLHTEINKYELEIPTNLVTAGLIGRILLACEEAIKDGRDQKSFLDKTRALLTSQDMLDARIDKRLAKLFDAVADLEAQEWNRIWCRIIRNTFSPSGFGKIDFLVGNPPWVRWSRLPRSYRDRVREFCNFYGLVSGRGYSGGIESDISTVVLYSAADHWLRIGGRIGILITWPVFKSASARGFRIGALPDGTGLLIDEIADLTAIQPFPDATNETAIYVASKVSSAMAAKFEKTRFEKWKSITGPRIPPTVGLEDALQSIKIEQGVACPVSDWGTPLWTGNAEAYSEASAISGRSPYLEAAHRGTVSDLARVFWVKVESFSRDTGRALIRTLTKEELPGAREVKITDGMWIESDLLYPLVRGQDLGRYCINTNGWYQIIPNRHYEAVADEEDFANQYNLTYRYLLQYKDFMINRATYRRYQSRLPFYVIYCVGEYSFQRWRVAWMEQQNPAFFRCAVLPEGGIGNLPNSRPVPDHKLYFIDLESSNEAHFVCAYLNSRPVREWLGGFLHGKQIGTSVVEFTNLPEFEQTDPVHMRLAAISLQAHQNRDDSRDVSLLSGDLEDELADLVVDISSRPPGLLRTIRRS